MDRIQSWAKENPHVTVLSLQSNLSIGAYLSERGWISSKEKVLSISSAGQGNMNTCLRVQTTHSSLILKQSLPWVSRYPSIAAPFDRILGEAAFYQRVRNFPAVSLRLPRFLGLDPDSRVMALEDLGECCDFTSIYAEETHPRSWIFVEELVSFLVALHQVPLREGGLKNISMRELNHAHIFDLPLRTKEVTDLDRLTPGLSQMSMILKTDEKYCEKVNELGQLYLKSRSGALLHGDFFPGSWLSTNNGIRVIDPEFCFQGPEEFDLGVLLAHLWFGDAGVSQINDALEIYQIYRKSKIDVALAKQFAGVEIMRRLLGVAQLPLDLTLEQKREYLFLSRDWVRG